MRYSDPLIDVAVYVVLTGVVVCHGHVRLSSVDKRASTEGSSGVQFLVLDKLSPGRLIDHRAHVTPPTVAIVIGQNQEHFAVDSKGLPICCSPWRYGLEQHKFCAVPFVEVWVGVVFTSRVVIGYREETVSADLQIMCSITSTRRQGLVLNEMAARPPVHHGLDFVLLLGVVVVDEHQVRLVCDDKSLACSTSLSSDVLELGKPTFECEKSEPWICRRLLVGFHVGAIFSSERVGGR